MGYLFVFVETLHIWFLGLSRCMEERESKESIYAFSTDFNGIYGYQSVFNNNCFVNVYVLAKRKEKTKYRSKFEEEVDKWFGDRACYECEKIEYEKPSEKHFYTPDFTNGNVRYEVKGRFRDIDEAKKYLFIRDSNPDLDLRFIIASEKTMMPRSKKTTIKQWLEKNGFTVYVWGKMPKKLLENNK